MTCHDAWYSRHVFKKEAWRDFLSCTVNKNLPASAGEAGSILVQEDSSCRGATKPIGHNY